jgi:hypothetical protein
MSAPRSRRRRFVAGAAALGILAGFALLATGAASLAAPVLVVTYLALIPAALLA